MPQPKFDVSHDNCLIDGKKDYRSQSAIIMEVMQYLENRPDLRYLMKGFMLESYLKEGNQKLDACDASSIDLEGLSISDPCLDLEQTKALLLELARKHFCG